MVVSVCVTKVGLCGVAVQRLGAMCAYMHASVSEFASVYCMNTIVISEYLPLPWQPHTAISHITQEPRASELI